MLSVERKIILSFFICFIGLVVLVLVKLYLLRIYAIDYHNNIIDFTTIAQLALLLVTGLYTFFVLHRKLALAAFVLLAVVELLLGYTTQAIVKNPSETFGLKDKRLTFIHRGYADAYLFPIPQEDTGCVQYDPELYYILRKNHAHPYKRSMFSTTIYSNILGVRDDEASLQKPEIICLGDSYTMGWGADKPYDIPSLIEQKMHKKVLNTGISSYGTARETLLLRRVDTSNVRYIIVQYCANDDDENQKYIQNNYRLPISTKERLYLNATLKKQYQIYFPLKYILSYANFFITMKKDKYKLQKKEPTAVEITQETQKKAANCLDIIKRASINFDKTKVIIYPEMNNMKPNETAIFCDEITRLTKNTPYARCIKAVAINVPSNLRLRLDPHYNLQGNEYVADIISKEILADMQ
jgi:hypothetical protein